MGLDEQDSTDVDVDVDGTSAVFSGIESGVDLEFESLPQGVKETLVLNSAASDRRFRFSLDLQGLSVRLSADGGIEYVDPEGDVVAVTPPGFMEDDSGDVSLDVTYALEEGQVVVQLDDEWLDAANYPVEVDPTTILNTSVWDTHVVQGSAANVGLS